MKIFKRAFLSITQQKSKSIILFLTTFILGNVLCASVALSVYIQNVHQEFLNQYGARISFVSNERYQEILSSRVYNRLSAEKIMTVFQDMMKDQRIEYGDYTYVFSGLQSDKLVFSDENEKDSFENLYVWGSEHSDFLDLRNNKIHLIEGRSFTSEELKEGKNVLLISKEFKYKNEEELKIGDHLLLQRNIYPAYEISKSSEDVLYSETVDYEIIGFFESNDLEIQNQIGNTADNLNAKVYVPNETIRKESKRFDELNREYANDSDNINHFYILGDAFFQLKDSKSFESFIETYESFFTLKIVPNSYKVITSDDLYKKISGPVNVIQNISDYILWIAIICTILILNFVIFILTKDRKNEIGILIALGEKRRNVLFQMILEIWAVGLLALNLSMIGGQQISRQLSDYLVTSSIKKQGDILSEEEEIQQKQLLENYEVKFDRDYIMILNGIGSVVLLLSSTLSVMTTFRSKPKEILLK